MQNFNKFIIKRLVILTLPDFYVYIYIVLLIILWTVQTLQNLGWMGFFYLCVLDTSSKVMTYLKYY